MKQPLRIFLLLVVLTTAATAGNKASQATAQTVIDLHTGRISAKTRDDYKIKTREDWQLREDSIAYNDCVTRAFNYLYADSLQTAQNLFEKALKLRPDAPGNIVVRHNIARIFMARCQWKDAITLLSRVITEDPRYLEAREDRASSYIELKLFDKALKDYAQLRAIKPDEEHYHLLYAMMLSETGEKRDALDELDDLMEKHKDYAECYLVRAGIHIDLGEMGYARRDLDKAVSLGIPKTDIIHLYKQLK